MRNMHIIQERQRYSIRKYSFGAASVLIGASLLLGGQALAQEEVPVASVQDQTVLVAQSETVRSELASSEVISDLELHQDSVSTAVLSAASSEVAGSELLATSLASSQMTSQVLTSEGSLANPSPLSEESTFSQASSVSQAASLSPASSESVSQRVHQSEAQLESRASAVSDTDRAREVLNTGFRTVSSANNLPGVSGPVTADGSMDIPASGTYYFRRTTEIRTAPVMDIKPTFVFSRGDHVIYDKVLKRDGHQWISYLGYDYQRYYADIASLRQVSQPTRPVVTNIEEIPEKGTYAFTKPADVKNQASLTAKTEFILDPGMTVNYDKALTADNHRWISYVSYSGIRRYVDLGALSQVDTKPRGDIAVQKQDNGDFSVVISNVSDPNGILGVSVPIWSEQNGQDDIIWYSASKMSNGSYKVNVKISDHHNNSGLYHVHLYYVESNGKLVGVGGTTHTVPAAPVEETSMKGLNLPASGTYVFKERSSIKAEPRMAAAELAYYDKGMSVNYDKVVQADGHQWLSYVSYAGNRRYVPVASLAPVVAKSSGKITISNLTSQGFDVIISDVTSGGRKIQEVVVPVWSVKDNQDDLQWLSAQKQADGSYKTHVSVSDHKNDHGEYLVHLYYKIDGKLEGVGGTSTNVPAPSPATSRHNLPASGTYTFAERSSIKADPHINSPELAYYDKGMSVNYDKVLTSDGYTWLSYLSYAGSRRYVAIAKASVAPAQAESHTVGLPASGRYTFSENAGIKTEPRLSSADITYFAPGMSVNYDKVLTAEGHTWLSYISYGGRRLYVDLESENSPSASASNTVSQPSLPSSGHYTFTSRTSVLSEPNAANPELAYYDKGMTVNYDRLVTANGHTWLSYLSYSGARSYVMVG